MDPQYSPDTSSRGSSGSDNLEPTAQAMESATFDSGETQEMLSARGKCSFEEVESDVEATVQETPKSNKPKPATSTNNGLIGQVSSEAESKPIPRNRPCSCGSGRKYKKCHGKEQGIDEMSETGPLESQHDKEQHAVDTSNLDDEVTAAESSQASAGKLEGNAWNGVLDAAESDDNDDDDEDDEINTEEQDGENGEEDNEDEDTHNNEFDDKSTNGGNEAGDEEKNQEEEQRAEDTFEDTGAFNAFQICNILGHDQELDECRMTRLRHGFFKLFQQP